MAEDNFETDIETCLSILKKGGIILYPTDTIWGIGCDATNAAAVEKIIALKDRPLGKSFVVLVASEKDVLRYTASTDLTVFDYLHTVKKPTTVIYKHALALAENVCADDGSVAIRICKDTFCIHLLKRFRKPIVSTSANISGEDSPQNFAHVSNFIKRGVDYIVQYKQDDNTLNSASSLIRWVKGKAEILRS